MSINDNNNSTTETFTSPKGNNYNLTSLMIGGTDMVQANRADQPAANPDNRPAAAISGFGPGHPSLEVSGGQVREMGVQTFNGSGLKSAFGGDILSTARSAGGVPISDMSKVTDDTIVECKGATLQVKTAIRMGLLAKDAHGNIIDPSANGSIVKTTENTPQQPQRQQVKVDLGQNSRENINAIYRQMGPQLADSTVASLIGAAFRGDTNREEVIYEDTANMMGVSRQNAKAVIKKAFDDVTDRAMEFGEKQLGLPMSAIAEHLDKCSNQFKVDCYLRMFHNDLTVFDDLNKMYRTGNKY
ncbi:hypothetical protein DSCO28_07920 [Desulfosarcina ovata subsp. sediminis]|uniref:Uncharacterized protein n=1 Tax=Desulfosarcina ovata subsp. sediminis TaxID=885957 RepID=A0A5K7ZGW7_9BACT|nr:hypothetical protein [Desulfosarcina ovata]BBO80226.1 hypothetical protein DSCO28_07920 [Desulfosarcina ovata subsp. sediminis]